MENFLMYNPTQLHFGKNVIEELPKAIQEYGKRVLLVYGKNSIKKNGIYNIVIEKLKSAKAEVYEYSGIKSNPVISDVDAAAEIGRKNQIEVVLAVGGGSVIDSAKIISLAIPLQCNAWQIFEGKVKPAAAIPLVAVLTLAATGTEMNPFAVVQNDETKQKPGYFSPLIFPKHSFLDPSYTISVPASYTAYGIVDLVAHALEGYFGYGDATLTDKFIFSIIREAVEYGPKLMNDLTNYAYREKIMFAATCALNGMTAWGKASGDWGVHSLGHALSVLYDIPHGATLSVAYPAWMKYFKATIINKLELLGKEVFQVHSADETIRAFEEFFKLIGAPVTMAELNIPETKKTEIIKNMIANKTSGYHYKLSAQDIVAIVDLMYKK